MKNILNVWAIYDKYDGKILRNKGETGAYKGYKFSTWTENKFGALFQLERNPNYETILLYYNKETKKFYIDEQCTVELSYKTKEVIY